MPLEQVEQVQLMRSFVGMLSGSAEEFGLSSVIVVLMSSWLKSMLCRVGCSTTVLPASLKKICCSMTILLWLGMLKADSYCSTRMVHVFSGSSSIFLSADTRGLVGVCCSKLSSIAKEEFGICLDC